MWDYSEKVKEHFFNPKNVGQLDNPSGVGEVGSIACGDALRLTLDVDPATDIIRDAAFQTFGCGSAIASSSALTEMVIGKPIDEALRITNKDIADFLGGLPAEKMHCSVMGWEALHAAIADYRGEDWSDDHEDGALVCKCFAVDEPRIHRTIVENDLTTVDEVINYTKAGGGCGCCVESIEKVLAEVEGKTPSGGRLLPMAPAAPTAPPLPATSEPAVAAMAVAPAETAAMTASASADAATMTASSAPGETSDASPASETSPKGGKPRPLSRYQRIRKIEQAIDEMRPTLRQDGGDIELIDVDDDYVAVHMTGACSGCQLASMTLGMIQQRIMESIGEFLPIIPVEENRAAAGV